MFNLISNEKEKMKVINYYHFSTALQMCAVIGTVAAPLTLYSVELGLDPDRIGILGSLMAFCQVLALISIPLTLYFGSKILSIWTLFSRYIFYVHYLKLHLCLGCKNLFQEMLEVELLGLMELSVHPLL